jgi:hypothetical protein
MSEQQRPYFFEPDSELSSRLLVLLNRVDRLNRLVQLNAPRGTELHEIELIRAALDLVEQRITQ